MQRDAPQLAAAAGAAAGDVGVLGIGPSSSGSFCTPHLWSLSSGAGVHEVNGSAVTVIPSGTFGGTAVDGLAIARDGSYAYVASVTDGTVKIQRMSAATAVPEVVATFADAVLTRVVGGTVSLDGSRYYYGGYTRSGSVALFELYAYDINTGTSLGRVGRIQLPNTVDRDGVGDIAFRAGGDLVLLWSPADGNTGTGGQIAVLAGSNLPSGGATVTAALLHGRGTQAGGPWNGLAADALGNLWIQRPATGGGTYLAKLNAAGGLDDNYTTANVVGVDLASCGPSTSLVLQKDVASRVPGSTDQFGLHISQVGSSTDLATATTTGTALGVQPVSAGPVGATAGASYVIGETGEAGASLANYTRSYACVWVDGTTFASGALPYDAGSGRAQVALPAIPTTGRDSDRLTCTITNTVDTVALQPTLTLTKALSGTGRRNASDQFVMSIRRSGSATVIASTTTTGSGATVGAASAGPVSAEFGATFVITERMASGSVSTITQYTSTFICTWSGDGSVFVRGALVASGGAKQAELPPIPAGRQSQALNCTITNVITPANGLTCEAGTVWVAEGGTETGVTVPDPYRVRPVTVGGIGTAAFSGIGGTTSRNNALAVSLDGTQSYLAGAGARIRRWDSASNTVTDFVPSRATQTNPTPGSPGNNAGAIDPTTGYYYWGNFARADVPYPDLYPSDGVVLHLYALPAGGSATTASPGSYWQAARIWIPGAIATASYNGDIAFDAAGNLYIVAGPSNVAPDNSSLIARIDSAQVPRTMPTTVPNYVTNATKITNLAGLTNQADVFNGITFDADGWLWVSSRAGVKRIDPLTGANVGTPVTVDLTKDPYLVDLASCGLPPTMRLQKNIVARAKTDDQFRIEIHAGTPAADATPAQQAVTSGSTPGVQTQVAGPVVVTAGNTYTIRETAANGTDLNDYITSYSCSWSDETVIQLSGTLTGDGHQRSATLAAIPSGKGGQQLVCTITNELKGPATVTVSKTMLDVHGENPVPYAGWNMTTTSATTGVTVSAPATRATASNGSVLVPWQLDFFSSEIAAVVVISEEQRDGYVFVDGSCTITPHVGAPVTVPITGPSITLTGDSATNRALRAGDQVECAFRNRLLAGSISWQKTDDRTPATHLAGSTWAVSGPGVPVGTVVADCTAAPCATGGYLDADPQPGWFTVDGLSPGNFSVTEDGAPAGYVRDSTVHRAIIASSPSTCEAHADDADVPRCLHVTFVDPFTNTLTTVPSIPLTGGLGADGYLILGGTVMATGLLGLVLWHRRRRGQTT